MQLYVRRCVVGGREICRPSLYHDGYRVSENYHESRDGRYFERLLFLEWYGIYWVVHHYPSDALYRKLMSVPSVGRSSELSYFRKH